MSTSRHVNRAKVLKRFSGQLFLLIKKLQLAVPFNVESNRLFIAKICKEDLKRNKLCTSLAFAAKNLLLYQNINIDFVCSFYFEILQLSIVYFQARNFPEMLIKPLCPKQIVNSVMVVANWIKMEIKTSSLVTFIYLYLQTIGYVNVTCFCIKKLLQNEISNSNHFLGIIGDLNSCVGSWRSWCRLGAIW